MSRLTLIDPLTLVGRELVALLPDARTGLEISCVHTTDEDEHQIGEIASEAMLITPLDDPEQLSGSSIVVICDPEPGERFRIVRPFLEANPDVAVLDLARTRSLAELTSPATSVSADHDWPPRLHLAHPALCAAATVLAPLTHLQPRRLSIGAFDPASSFGEDALACMARQAASRIQGEHVQDRIGGEILAFNLVIGDASALLEEAAQLLPGVVTTGIQGLSGCFHGHAACLDITFDHTVDEVALAELWSTEPDIQVGELPIRLDAIPGSDRITLTPPVIAADGSGVTVTAMVDGLRIGGALTAVRILEAMATEVR